MPPQGTPGKRSARIDEEDIQKVMKLHLQGVDTDAIRQRLNMSTATIREIVNVRRQELGMEPVTPKKVHTGWTPPSTDLTKSRYTTKAIAKGVGA